MNSNTLNAILSLVPDAIVIYANYAAFSPGKTAKVVKEQSLMLLWCKSGKGTVTVNRNKYQFQSGDFLFMPWNHSVSYHADKDEPFLVAGIHLIPELKSRGMINYTLYNQPRPNLEEHRQRHNVPALGFSTEFSGKFKNHRPLEELAEYTVAWFNRQPRNEQAARMLARLLFYEIFHAQNHQYQQRDGMPVSLLKILDYIDGHLEHYIKISNLCVSGSCSRTTMFRLFKEHIRYTPSNWIMKRKTEHASELLRKTSLSIEEIAGRVCVDDVHYFSRVFKKFQSVSPRQYRNENSLICSIMHFP
jgi:AraC-like DNA-binding protein